MPIHYEAWRFWVSIAQTLITVAIAVYVWLITRDRVTNKRITDLDNKMGEMLDSFKSKQSEKCASHLKRTTSLEVSVSNMPTHSDLGDIHEKINDVNGAVKELSGLIRSINGNMRLLVEHHLKGDGQ